MRSMLQVRFGIIAFHISKMRKNDVLSARIHRILFRKNKNKYKKGTRMSRQLRIENSSTVFSDICFTAVEFRGKMVQESVSHPLFISWFDHSNGFILKYFVRIMHAINIPETPV